MPSRLPGPRTCRYCGGDFTSKGNPDYLEHRLGTCPECKERRHIQYLRNQLVVSIEQAIARGLPTSRIMADLAVTYEDVHTVRQAMEEVACEGIVTCTVKVAEEVRDGAS